MLTGLSIRDVVLIERLDLHFTGGLATLTGETGAGKSILLDALGLALGNRAEQRLVRKGADQAIATAVLEPPADHPAYALIKDQGIDVQGEPLILRRVLGADGRSRAYINDMAVTVGLLRQVGDSLIEVQGQFEQRGLLDAANHRLLLDASAGLGRTTDKVAGLWEQWKESDETYRNAALRLETAQRDEAYLRHVVGELSALDPKSGEEAALGERRQLLMNQDKLNDALSQAQLDLSGEGGAEARLISAQRALARMGDKAGSRLDALHAALERSASELAEAGALLDHLMAGDGEEGGSLEEVENRFFALKDAARKHNVDCEGLPDVLAKLSADLDSIETGSADLTRLAAEAEAAKADYFTAAKALSTARIKAAKDLDSAVNAELPPLKLEKARFTTRVDARGEDQAGPTGLDRVFFEVATNPGAEPGPMHKIASGGELARFLLALKVVLAGVGDATSLIFDEVDAGIGGATAAAVGERLHRLAKERQVLVVTHSPQVAALAAHHLRVSKAGKDSIATTVESLDASQRREEIARMLSGAEITDEARAAAEKLLKAS